MSVSTKSYIKTSEMKKYMNGDDPDSGTIQQTVSSIMNTKTNGIEALPYQFMDTVDRRVVNTTVGRKYSDKIFSRMPLLFLTPCEPLFMDDFAEQERDAVLGQLLTGQGAKNIGDILRGKSANGSVNRYYSTEFAYSEYYPYVNTMLSCLSVYLGLFNTKIPLGGTKNARKIGTMDWSKELNKSFKTFFSCKENLIFYLNGLDTVTESFDNQTTESSLASQINQFADMSNEIRFLFGKNGSLVNNLMASGENITSSISSGLSGLAQDVAGGIVGSLANKGVNSVLNGGKIVFPKIWSDSGFSRSFNIDISLKSPDHDNLSIFLNILKPYCKLLALVMPRQLTKNKDPNSYGAPFLVKAFSKGMFNIDMGMITSMSVTKGKSCAWNDNGLPTEIDISLTIEDLYSSLAMSSVTLGGNNTAYDVASNTAFMDFLANTAGMNIAQMEIGRRVQMTYYLTQMYVKNAPSNLFMKFDQAVSNKMGQLYNILS